VSGQHGDQRRTEPKHRSWPRRHKIITGLGVVAVVGIIAGVASSNSGSPAPTSGAGTSSSSAAGHTPGIGSRVRDGKFEFTVLQVTHRKTAGNPQFGGSAAQGEYTVLRVRVTNIGDVSQSLTDSTQYVYDSQGRKFDAASDANIWINKAGGSTIWQDINPGNSVTGLIAFDLPRGDVAVKAELHDSLFSGGVTVRLS